MTPQQLTHPCGCVVTVAIRTGMPSHSEQQFHWRGTEAACRRKAMLKTGAIRVLQVEPLDERTYVQAYGLAQRM